VLILYSYNSLKWLTSQNRMLGYNRPSACRITTDIVDRNMDGTFNCFRQIPALLVRVGSSLLVIAYLGHGCRTGVGRELAIQSSPPTEYS
jgi:hypothetical protein